jgi:hypothetical protein
MAIWKWIRGVIGAAMLTLFCVVASARIIEWADRPQPVRAKWPHMDTWAMAAVLVPAAVFWFVYFARYWRGRAMIVRCRRLAGCWRPIVSYHIKSFLWLVIILELYFIFLVASSPRVH